MARSASLFLRKTQMSSDVLGHLDVDPQKRVQRSCRVLGDQRYLLAPDAAELLAAETE